MKLEQLRVLEKSGVSSKTKLVLGAAGLLLFIVGVRKTFGPEGTPEGAAPPADRTPGPGPQRE